MHQNQVALMPQQREDGALSARLPFHFSKRIGRFQGDIGALRSRKLFPRRPAHTQHLVQHAGAFQRQRDGWQVFNGGFWRGAGDGRHDESWCYSSERQAMRTPLIACLCTTALMAQHPHDDWKIKPIWRRTSTNRLMPDRSRGVSVIRDTASLMRMCTILLATHRPARQRLF